jgi:hypothetical protein
VEPPWLNQRQVVGMKTTIAAPPGMKRRRHAAALIAASVTILAEAQACNSKQSVDAGPGSMVPLADKIVVAGNRILTRDQFAIIASRPGFAAGDFVRGWAADATLAEAARAGALDPGRVRQVERSVLARATLEQLHSQAVNQGVPTPRELADVTAERWFEVDRPAAAQTTHFVVRTKEGRPTAGAEALAGRIADTVRNIRNAQEFKAAVNAFPRQGLEVVAESLPPITSDGRSLRLDADGKPIGPGPVFDSDFARAANAIEHEGAQSGIVHTQFGFHVILLERKLASYQTSIEFRRERFSSEIISRRARQAADRQVQDARQNHPVRVESSFQEIIAHAQVPE